MGGLRASLRGFAVVPEHAELGPAIEYRSVRPSGRARLVPHPPQSGQLDP